MWMGWTTEPNPIPLPPPPPSPPPETPDPPSSSLPPRPSIKTDSELINNTLNLLSNKQAGKTLLVKSKLRSMATQAKNAENVNHEEASPDGDSDSSSDGSSEGYVDESDGEDARSYHTDSTSGNPQDHTPRDLEAGDALAPPPPTGAELRDRKKAFLANRRREIARHGGASIYKLYELWQAKMEEKREYIESEDYLRAEKTKRRIRDIRYRLVQQAERQLNKQGVNKTCRRYKDAAAANANRASEWVRSTLTFDPNRANNAHLCSLAGTFNPNRTNILNNRTLTFRTLALARRWEG
jgi:hypothetical protein